MEKLFVDLGKKSYDILFSDSFNGFAKAMSDINAPKKLLVVTDSNVIFCTTSCVDALCRK